MSEQHYFLVTKNNDVVEVWLHPYQKRYDLVKSIPIIGNPILPSVIWMHKAKLFNTKQEAFDYVRPYYFETLRVLKERLDYETDRLNKTITNTTQEY